MRWRFVVTFVALVALVTGAVPALAGNQGWNQTGAWTRGPMARGQNPRVRQSTLALSPELTGALSGLVRDPEGFYWSHTDQGTGIEGWLVRLVKLKVTPRGVEVLEIIPLRDEAGNPVLGDSLDPEDIVVAPDGTLWLSDEIHPLIVQVSREGQILRRVHPPQRYSARTSGRGFEGLALSPNGQTLYAMLQTGLATQEDRTLTWILAYDLTTGAFTEYPYQLDRPSDEAYLAGVKPWVGASGLAAVAPGVLLVLERDNQSGTNARIKRVYRVTVPDGAATGRLDKELVVDLYKLGYDLEKVEGMAVPHPNTMVLVNDNDGDLANPTVLWYLQW